MDKAADAGPFVAIVHSRSHAAGAEDHPQQRHKSQQAAGQLHLFRIDNDTVAAPECL